MNKHGFRVQVRLTAVSGSPVPGRRPPRPPVVVAAPTPPEPRQTSPLEVGKALAGLAAVPAVVTPPQGPAVTTRVPAATTRPTPAPRPRPAAPARARAATARTVPRPGWRRHLPLLSILGVLAVLNLVGLSYYVSPIASRVRDPLHDWLKPSGYVGQAAGLLAFLLFAFLYLYPVRKRFRRLEFLGQITRWLDVHIVAGLVVPVLGAVHAAWRVNGIIGWGYFSMLMVSLSGIVGKYLYVHIPRSRNGIALSLGDIDSQRADLLASIAEMTGLAVEDVDRALGGAGSGSAPRGLVSSAIGLLSSDFARWRMVRRLRARLRKRSGSGARLDAAALREVVRLARREIALTQQMRVLAATQRLFRYWHVFHRPFSITAFVAVTIHVVVVVSLGVTWLW